MASLTKCSRSATSRKTPASLQAISDQDAARPLLRCDPSWRDDAGIRDSGWFWLWAFNLSCRSARGTVDEVQTRNAAPPPHPRTSREPSAFDCKQAPFTRHAFEVLTSAFSEGQSGAGDQVFDCTRYENFARVGQGRHTGTDVNRYSADLLAHDYAFARVQTCSHLDPERAHTVGDRARTANGACGPVEDREKAITGGADLAATITCKFATDECVMIVQQVPP